MYLQNMWIIFLLIFCIFISLYFVSYPCRISRMESFVNVRVAIATMSKHAPDLPFWIDYHLNHVKVDKIYLRLEDPTLQRHIPVSPKIEFIDITSFSKNRNSYDRQQFRQIDFLKKVLHHARSQGITHLLHIDDDELIWVSPAFHSSLSFWIQNKKNMSQPNIHFQNMEAILSTTSSSSPFMNCYEFTDCRFGECRSYANGKSMANLFHTNIQPYGVHHFSGETYHVPVTEAVILHFDSITFELWQKKFKNLSNLDNQTFHDIPFPFYRQSIHMMKQPSSFHYLFWHSVLTKRNQHRRHYPLH